MCKLMGKNIDNHFTLEKNLLYWPYDITANINRPYMKKTDRDLCCPPGQGCYHTISLFSNDKTLHESCQNMWFQEGYNNRAIPSHRRVE